MSALSASSASAPSHFEQRLLQACAAFRSACSSASSGMRLRISSSTASTLSRMVLTIFGAGARQINAARAPVVLVGAPLDETSRLHAIEQAADCDLRQVEVGGERGLRHAVPARQKRQHPPLRARDAERLQRPIHHDAAQPRHVVDQEAEAKAGIEISWSSRCPSLQRLSRALSALCVRRPLNMSRAMIVFITSIEPPAILTTRASA